MSDKGVGDAAMVMARVAPMRQWCWDSCSPMLGLGRSWALCISLGPKMVFLFFLCLIAFLFISNWWL